MNNHKTKKGILSYTILTTAIVLTLVLGYSGYRLAAAEYAFGQALQAVAANDGNRAHARMSQAIRLNPFEARYRTTFSQTELAIANNLAARGEEITDADRATIQQLISLAIAEGKNAVALNRTSAGLWANLANVYRNLINVAQGADQWAISTYQQAIFLDPNNPQLRLAYGQLLFSLNQIDPAQRQFEIAASLKPDFANAHYNLAVTLKQQEKFALAKSELEQTLSLVEAGSDDFANVQEELNIVSQLVETEETPGTETPGVREVSEPALTSPEEATPPAALEPPLELPFEQAAPPELDLSPSPEASPSPTPTSTLP